MLRRRGDAPTAAERLASPSAVGAHSSNSKWVDSVYIVYIVDIVYIVYIVDGVYGVYRVCE